MITIRKHTLALLGASGALAIMALGASTASAATPPIPAELYVGAEFSFVHEFGPGANGNVPPAFTLSGPNTQFQDAVPGVAFDSAGDLFVADDSTSQPEVHEFAPGAHGNASPINSIGGFPSTLVQPLAVALDRSDNLFVADWDLSGAIDEFARGTKFPGVPIRQITGIDTGLDTPSGLAIDAAGHVFAANRDSNSITEFAADANGDASPIANIKGAATGLAQPHGVALDGAGHIFVANEAGSITEYANGANGNVAPIATISGPLTGLDGLDGLAIDAAGRLVVAGYTYGRISEFASGAHGDVAPIATISGAATDLTLPAGIALATPGVRAAAPTGVAASGATLHGTVNPTGSDTHYYFQYGLTTKYGSKSTYTDARAGKAALSVSATIPLAPGMTYHYQLVASSDAGMKYSPDRTFKTP